MNPTKICQQTYVNKLYKLPCPEICRPSRTWGHLIDCLGRSVNGLANVKTTRPVKQMDKTGHANERLNKQTQNSPTSGQLWSNRETAQLPRLAMVTEQATRLVMQTGRTDLRVDNRASASDLRSIASRAEPGRSCIVLWNKNATVREKTQTIKAIPSTLSIARVSTLSNHPGHEDQSHPHIPYRSFSGQPDVATRLGLGMWSSTSHLDQNPDNPDHGVTSSIMLDELPSNLDGNFRGISRGVATPTWSRSLLEPSFQPSTNKQNIWFVIIRQSHPSHSRWGLGSKNTFK